MRSLKLNLGYLKFTDKIQEKFHIPSTFVPPDGSYPVEINELEIQLNQAVRALPDTCSIKDNLSKAERQALKELKTDTSIVIKKADKGSAIVIMDRADYIKEASRQLNDERHYKEIDTPQYPDNCDMFNELLYQMKSQNLINSKELNYLSALKDSRERIFYILPKIHKDPSKWTVKDKIPPGRPIVSDVNSESYNISKFIDYHLAPYATQHESYVKNTYDFLDKIKQVKLTRNAILVSLDVESLYTNIQHDFGIDAVSDAFSRNPKPIHPFIIKLLRLSLEGNDFTFNSKHFLQISGTAMGKKFAPHYADITMAYWERENLKKCDKKPTFYFRYLDDIAIAWEHSRSDFQEFFDILNSSHVSIKLSQNVQDNQLEFLDVLIFKGANFERNGILDTKVYFKPTDSHALLHKSSYHPKHTFTGLIKSQLIRFGRICDHQEDYEVAKTTLFKVLKDRGYTRSFLRKIDLEVRKQYFPYEAAVGMIPCGSNRCSICKHVSPINMLKTNTGVQYLTSNANCNTKGAIYLLWCTHCPNSYYVGQTTDLRSRFINHLSNIRTNKDTSVAEHFQTHDINHLRLTVLEKVDKLDKLDKIERKWIQKLDSFKNGLNRDPGNRENMSIFVLQHNPLNEPLLKIATTWWEKFKTENPTRIPKKPFKILKASAKNKNLSGFLVRALLPTIEEADE